MSDAQSSPSHPDKGRQRALREELTELAEVVAPGSLVDLLLQRAFELKATDIHLDPTPNGLRIRLRVDGLMHDVLFLSPEAMTHVISRVKLMAGMDITERRLVQDGHISTAVLKHQRDVRVASSPTIHGERLVLRLMPDSREFTELDELGLNDEQITALKKYLNVPYGMILCVGPVGAGKSTTIYSCLNQLNDATKSLVTIEDPVERQLDGVNQIQVDPRIGFGFVEALRGILRQDPNVLMIGEIRDAETAHIACQAAMTGTLVLSTLHANDTASAIDVFREYEIPPMFIADSLIGIVAQRLIRRVPPTSRETYHPDASACRLLNLDPQQADHIELVRGVPSEENFYTGYQGRTGVFEIMQLDTALREAILKGHSHSELMELARSQGMQSLEAVTRKKVLAGMTSLEEMQRVLTTFPAGPGPTAAASPAG